MEPSKHKLVIAEYNEYPGPRYCSQGDSSGEDFYHTILNSSFAQAINDNSKLTVNLDGTAGYASSFLDEAFGNLVYDFTLDLVKKNLIIVSQEEPDWKEMIEGESFGEWEERRIGEDEVFKSIEHQPWTRYIEGQLVSNKWK